MAMQRLPLSSIALTGLLVGCRGGPTAPEPLPAPELRAAPTVVTLAGKPLVLETFLWRDFMPISPPDGKPLIAVLRVRAADGTAVPPGVRADAVWVVFGGEVWTAREVEERARDETAPFYEAVARNGPKWGPGVTVEVVVRLRDSTGRSVLLRAADQLVHRTD
jgi:hypothetical protein